MRVVTYNIRRCIGIDGRRDPQRILRTLTKADGDAILLQEVSTFPVGCLSLPAWFAERLGCQLTTGPLISKYGWDYGNVLLTRCPVLFSRSHDLTEPDREPRGAIEALLRLGHRTVRLVGTHLGLDRRERGKQVQALARIAGASRGEDITVLGGDLNERWPNHTVLRPLHALLGRPPALRTYPALFPICPLDRVWVRPATSLAAVTVLRTAGTRIGSDHLPLIADVTTD